jgi:hypothetical protein
VRVDAHARPLRRDEARHAARGRREAAPVILGIDAAFDRVAVARQVAVRRVERGALRDLQLPADQVDAGDHLRHRMLDLDARVHLHEVELAAVLVEDVLDGARAAVADVLAKAHGGLGDDPAQSPVEHRRRRLLDELLVRCVEQSRPPR